LGKHADPSVPVLDTLARRIDRSLVVATEANGEVRYRYPETIRQYAHERLAEVSTDRDAFPRAHALYFLAQAEAAEPWLYESEAPRLLAQLATEHDNLRAALRWTLDAGECDLALRLGASLYRFWRLRGYVREGRQWLEDALQQCADSCAADEPAQFARVRALNAAGVLARDASDYATAKLLLMESVELFERLADEERLVNAEQNLGQALFRLGEYEPARVARTQPAVMDFHDGARDASG
jgi:hypothetical protein